MGAVIVDWLRSPFTRAHKGGLSEVRPDELGGQVLRRLLEMNQFPHSQIDDILVGCAYPEGEQGYNIGRMMTHLANLPSSVPGSTINRLCGSSMQAIMVAASNINSGWGDCFVCGGIESMSRVKRRGFNWSQHPGLTVKYPQAYINMGETAENVAKEFNISRLEQEEFALNSHQRATEAISNGKFENEIVAITLENGSLVKDDGCVRSETSIESMSRLPPAFAANGSVTAATSSPLTDGAVFSLVCSKKFASDYNLSPIAEIISVAITGCPPEMMGMGPVSATNLALSRAGWKLSDIEVFELNEAFSSQSIACIRELGIDDGIVNIDGGAISIGHPLGASGARITCKASSIMQREGANRAIAAMCIGGGMGIAIALQSPDYSE